MKLKVTKITQTPSGDYTLTLTGVDGLHGEVYLPVPPPEKDVYLHDIGQEFELTPGAKPVPEKAPVPAAKEKP